ncbi:O-antigen ligase family protein [bacterium]|nr:O-antigen ligase family protein [bacterium]
MQDSLDDKLYSIKKSIYTPFSKVHTNEIAFILILLLVCQPLYGIFTNSSTASSLIATFYGKATIIRFIGIIGLLNGFIDYYCKRFIYRKKYWDKTFLKNSWTGLFAILLIIAFLSALFCAKKYEGFLGDAYRYEGFLSYLAYAGIFVSASLLNDEKEKKNILVILVSISFVVAIVTMLRELAGFTFLMKTGGRVMAWSGTFINPNHYGYYLAVCMMVSVGLYQDVDKWYKKLIYGIIFLTNNFVLAKNESYGPFLAILFGFILYAVFYIIRNGFKESWYLLILFALFIGMSFLVNNKLANDIVKTFTEFLNISSSIGEGIGSGDMDEALDGVEGGSGRFSLWKAAIKVMLKYPIFGCGPENIQYIIHNYGGTRMSIPHNEVLQIGANMGIPAMLVYVTAMIWFGVVAIKNIKKLSNTALIAGCAVATYLASSLVGVSMTITTCFLFLVLGLTNSWFKERNQEDLNRELLESLNIGDIKKEETTEEPEETKAVEETKDEEISIENTI